VKEFPVESRSLIRRSDQAVHAVNDVSLEVRAGETLGLVGQTGSGKSTLARCLTRLCDLTSGSVTFDGVDISNLSRRELRPIRRQVQIIFQDPYSSLNPRRRVGSIIGDPFSIHGICDGAERKRRVQEMMEIVGLNPEHYNRFPSEFSGGQRQRIGIARALALRPKLIVCDEAVSALDVSIQAQVINLLTDLQGQFGLTYVFIGHDLSVVQHVSDRVAVMYLGAVVEVASVEDLYRHHQHPYSAALLSAIPLGDPSEADRRERIVLTGDVPSSIHPPSGCHFHPRCWKARAVCSLQAPDLIPREGAAEDHVTACYFPLTDQAPRQADSPDVDRENTLPGGPDDVEPLVAEPSPRTTAEPPRIEGRSPLRLAGERLRRDRVAICALVVIVMIAIWALAAPLISHLMGHPPNEQYHQTGQTPEGLPVGPRGEFWFGTDNLGRDLLVRIGYGLRLSLFVAVLSTLGAVTIGMIVGLMSGYFGGIVDTVLARFADVVLALPFLLFAISLVSVAGQSLPLIIVLIAMFSWASVARIVRGQVLSIRAKEYVEAARSLGSSDSRIMFLDILPNVLAPVIVYTTLLIPSIVIVAASLSFLGIGTPPPTADLGAMLASSVAYYRQAWWFVAFPGAALLLATLAFNLFGDGVRDAFDPRADRAVRRRGK
jgi:oligopeptide/dipeptide ABC transporter ATP-binding protein